MVLAVLIHLECPQNLCPLGSCISAWGCGGAGMCLEPRCLPLCTEVRGGKWGPGSTPSGKAPLGIF